MIHFESDYTEGVHPSILDALYRTNMEQTSGYGEDLHCEHARACIRESIGMPEADVHFLVGGTQTNVTVISALLRPHQGAVCAVSGHINVHETGALEHIGYKALDLPSEDGKLQAEQVEAFCEAHYKDPSMEHTVQPGCVYISHPTETGLLYTAAELEALSAVCEAYHMPLFVDGARLGYGLMAEGSDVTIQKLAECADVFYIGGTKVGALFGEAVVFTEKAVKKGLNRDFRYFIKQNGGMLAKGRLLGIQFEELFQNDLYLQLGKHADEQAARIRCALESAGCRMAYDSVTNQQFPILSRKMYEYLSREFVLSYMGEVDTDHVLVRICTSWATREETVTQLIDSIKAFH